MNKLKQTIRLKTKEAEQINKKSFELTKLTLLANHNIIYKESDLINFLISNCLDLITIDEDGALSIKK